MRESQLFAGPPRSIAFTEGIIAVGCVDGRVLLRSSETGEVIRTLVGHTGGVWGVAFSPDGTTIATASADNTARLWDATTGNQTQELTGHTSVVWGVAFSPDGTTIATASADGTARLWDTDGQFVDWFPPTWLGPDGELPLVASAVSQQHDVATEVDLLGRSALAGGLAGQLVALHEGDETRSFAVHVSGAWGSGKSSLVNLVALALSDESRAKSWVVPPTARVFDAWRESQVGPAWWSLLSWLRQTTQSAQSSRLGGRKWVGPIANWMARTWFGWRESFRRLRLAGLLGPASWIIGILVLAVFVSLGLYLANRADPNNQLGGLDVLLSLIGAVAVTITTLVGAGRTAARWWTWQTPAGARLFQRRDDNPMEDVITHASWLRSKVSGPLLLVLDDVDRCPAAFVVELLEAVQTLLRFDDDDAQPLLVIVNADDRWLHVAFERAYADFATRVAAPGRPLGHLFLAKLFQLHVRVPGLTPATAVDYGRAKLGVQQQLSASGPDPIPTPNRPRSPEMLSSSISEIERTEQLDDKLAIFDRVHAGQNADDIRTAALAVSRTSLSKKAQGALRHELEDYLALVEQTPRAILRFINAYAIQRLTTQTGPTAFRPSLSALARWTILDMRWPAVSERLIADPGQLDQWHKPNGPAADDEHFDLLRSSSFHAVVVDLKTNRPTLTSNDIRLCLGQRPIEPVLDLSISEIDPAADHDEPAPAPSGNGSTVSPS